MLKKILVPLFGLSIIGMTGPAHAVLYDLTAVTTSSYFSDFSVRYDDSGDTLLHYNEITSFSGTTYYPTGIPPISYNSVERVPAIPGFALDSGPGSGNSAHWTFSGSSGSIFGLATLWDYSRVVAGGPPPPGSTPGDPLLPTSTAGGFAFTFTPTDHTVPTFIDPDIAIGYVYEVVSGPNFASVIVPAALPNGDSAFTLDLGSFGTSPLVAGSAFNLLDIDPLGFSSFSILDIDVAELLDPVDPLAFVTGLTFLSAGQVELTQTPITAEVNTPIPEPSTILLLGAGLLGVVGITRRRRS